MGSYDTGAANKQQHDQQQNNPAGVGDGNEEMGYKRHLEIDNDATSRNLHGSRPGSMSLYGYSRRPQSERHVNPKDVLGPSSQHEHMSDQTHAIDSFFGGIRVPASFIVGVSFKELFGAYNANNESDIQRFLQAACLVCQGFAFVLSLSVVMLSSSAHVRGLTSNFDPYAKTEYDLLYREFHFEFLCCRWCFNTSLFGFLFAVGCKILYEFQLFDVNGDDFERHFLEIGIAVVLIMTALTLHLGSYVNSTLIGWNNMWDMTWDLLKVLAHRGISENHPMELVSLLSLGVGIVFLILSLIPGAQI